jgi:hypothetical protein
MVVPMVVPMLVARFNQTYDNSYTCRQGPLIRVSVSAIYLLVLHGQDTLLSACLVAGREAVKTHEASLFIVVFFWAL